MAICVLPTLLAQNATPPATNFQRHMVGLNFSNDITSQKINAGLMPNYSYRLQYGYTAALLYQYRVASWFSVESGIEYNSTAWYADNANSNIMDAWDGQSFNPSISSRLDFGQRMNRIAIPLNLRGYYQVKRWNFYGLAGLVFSMDWHSTYLNEISDWNRTYNFTEDGLNGDLGIGITAGIGAEYEINKHFLLRVEPRFRMYDVIKPNRPSFPDGDAIKAYPWAVGLNMGVYYKFGNK